MSDAFAPNAALISAIINASARRPVAPDSLLAALKGDTPGPFEHHVRAFLDETEPETLSDIVRSGALIYADLAAAARRHFLRTTRREIGSMSGARQRRTRYDRCMSFPTLTERKRAKVAAMQAFVEALAADLAAYARERGGRYILFGSAARGELRHDSDVDIMVAFPREAEGDAWDFAEDRAFALGLRPDVTDRGWSGPRLLDRIGRDGRVLA